MDLKIELTRVWKCSKVFIVHIIVGALGSVPKDPSLQLEKVQFPSSLIQKFQKTSIFYHITGEMLFDLFHVCLFVCIMQCSSAGAGNVASIHMRENVRYLLVGSFFCNVVLYSACVISRGYALAA